MQEYFTYLHNAKKSENIEGNAARLFTFLILSSILEV